MIFLQCCVWYLKNMPRDWIQLIFYRREEANKRSGCCEKKRELAPHNERAENDKWIGKLYFYYMKNHLYYAIVPLMRVASMKNCTKLKNGRRWRRREIINFSCRCYLATWDLNCYTSSRLNFYFRLWKAFRAKSKAQR